MRVLRLGAGIDQLPDGDVHSAKHQVTRERLAAVLTGLGKGGCFAITHEQQTAAAEGVQTRTRHHRGNAGPAPLPERHAPTAGHLGGAELQFEGDVQRQRLVVHDCDAGPAFARLRIGDARKEPAEQVEGFPAEPGTAERRLLENRVERVLGRHPFVVEEHERTDAGSGIPARNDWLRLRLRRRRFGRRLLVDLGCGHGARNRGRRREGPFVDGLRERGRGGEDPGGQKSERDGWSAHRPTSGFPDRTTRCAVESTHIRTRRPCRARRCLLQWRG